LRRKIFISARRRKITAAPELLTPSIIALPTAANGDESTIAGCRLASLSEPSLPLAVAAMNRPFINSELGLFLFIIQNCIALYNRKYPDL
jgi:hypothetical protein